MYMKRPTKPLYEATSTTHIGQQWPFWSIWLIFAVRLVLHTACLGTFATSLEHTKPQFILELLYWYFDGVVE